jgi:hypothetical protein
LDQRRFFAGIFYFYLFMYSTWCFYILSPFLFTLNCGWLNSRFLNRVKKKWIRFIKFNIRLHKVMQSKCMAMQLAQESKMRNEYIESSHKRMRKVLFVYPRCKASIHFVNWLFIYPQHIELSLFLLVHCFL